MEGEVGEQYQESMKRGMNTVEHEDERKGMMMKEKQEEGRENQSVDRNKGINGRGGRD